MRSFRFLDSKSFSTVGNGVIWKFCVEQNIFRSLRNTLYLYNIQLYNIKKSNPRLISYTLSVNNALGELVMFILYKLDLDRIISNIEMIPALCICKNNFVLPTSAHSLHNICALLFYVANIFVGKEYNTQV